MQRSSCLELEDHYVGLVYESDKDHLIMIRVLLGNEIIVEFFPCNYPWMVSPFGLTESRV